MSDVREPSNLGSSPTSYIQHRTSIDPGNFCSVSAVDDGRGNFLGVGLVASGNDLHVYGHAGREIHLVFVPDHFIEAKGVSTVILPAYPEAHDRLQRFTRFRLVFAFSFSDDDGPGTGICDAELAFFEFGAVGWLGEAG